MLVDVIAIMLGIWLGIRRMEVRSRQAEQCPQVDALKFADWKTRSSLVYNLGSLACFAEIALDHGFELLGRRLGLGFRAMQLGHALIFFAWIGALVWTGVAARRARRLGEELGITHSPRA